MWLYYSIDRAVCHAGAVGSRALDHLTVRGEWVIIRGVRLQMDAIAPEVAGRPAIVTTPIATPLGSLLAGAADAGVCLLEYTDEARLEMQLRRLGQRLNVPMGPGQSPYFAPLRRELEEYFAGRRREFSVPLLLHGTAFQRRVWEGLRAIPYGATRSYQAQAEALGQPRAVRAVAAANGANHIAILIPCHRVIGKDGTLTGYGGGLWRKEYLLNLEAGLRQSRLPGFPSDDEPTP
jgi:AraC family transcriptional regulator of adaptative response/methylated-DNA-[protein]-cysteine methyltransferase